MLAIFKKLHVLKIGQILPKSKAIGLLFLQKIHGKKKWPNSAKK